MTSMRSLVFLAALAMPGVAAQATCDPGYINVLGMTFPEGSQEDPCVACTAGTYQFEDTCVPCPEGQFQGSEAKTMCEDCPFGSANVGDDRTQCVHETVDPLITTQWGQSGGWSSPTYNAKTPLFGNTRAPLGCSAVAMGQVLNYLEYPKRGFLSHEYCNDQACTFKNSVNFKVKYDWDNMPDRLTSLSKPEEVEAVSTFLFHVGVSLTTRYGKDGSNAQFENPSVFKNFRKHFGMDVQVTQKATTTPEAWVELIKSEILQKRPVVLSGFDSTADAGHAYVLDGINSEGKVHINFGWSGSENGWYDLDNLAVFGGKYSFTEDAYAFTNWNANQYKVDSVCNGEYGKRCEVGLICALDDDVRNVADEQLSDEKGICIDPTKVAPPPENPTMDVVRQVNDIVVTKNQWQRFGPYESLYGIRVNMAGTGDADLHVTYGSMDPASPEDRCRPYKSHSNEKCNLQGSGPGSFYVGVHGYSQSSTVSLVITTVEEAASDGEVIIGGAFGVSAQAPNTSAGVSLRALRTADVITCFSLLAGVLALTF